MELLFPYQEINIEVLTEQLQHISPKVSGVATRPDVIVVAYAGDVITPDDLLTIVDIGLAIESHNADNVTDEQQLSRREDAYNETPELSLSNIRLLLLDVFKDSDHPAIQEALAKKSQIDAQYPISTPRT